jgi:cytidine deaminase
VVVTDAKTPAFPCALCLQVMAEFFDDATKIWIADTKEIRAVHEFIEVLPHPFGPRQLAEAGKKKS